jgi:hypothetical protein
MTSFPILKYTNVYYPCDPQLAKKWCVSYPFLNEIHKILIFKDLRRFFRSEAGNE